MKIVFTGGGTGGHIFPIIAIARELKKIIPSSVGKLELFYIGPGNDFFEKLLQKEGIKTKTILSGKLRRYFSPLSILKNFVDLVIRLPIGFLKALWLLSTIKPKIIFSKGGYGSLPVILVLRLFKITIFIHESDSIPGLANRMAAKYAEKIFLSFPIKKTEYFSKEKTIVVGNPVREEITEGSIETAKELFKLTGEKPILLILGGSQGAQRINDIILKTLPDIMELFEVIHQCGEKNYQEMITQTNIIFEKKPELRKYYHPYGFLDEEHLKHALKTTHIVISRAGAGFIFEILANGLPSILVPIPEAAQNHQRKNAYFCQDRGASLVVEEANLKPHFLIKKLHMFFSRPEKLKKMAKKARELAYPRSAQRIAQEIVKYLATG